MEAALTEDKDSLWFCPLVSDLFAHACLSELFHPELQGHAINLYYLFIPQPPPHTQQQEGTQECYPEGGLTFFISPSPDGRYCCASDHDLTRPTR